MHEYEKVKQYILDHPDESKVQQAIGAGVGESTIARVRARLVREGLLPASRKSATGLAQRTAVPSAEEPQVTPVRRTATPSNQVEGARDHEAMKQLADMVDLLSEEQDDAIVQKRLIKQCLNFAFDPFLSPDTRMSASQMWEKLRSRASQRALGPGKPKTRADAVARLKDMNLAAGADIVVEALIEAFGLDPLIKFLETALAAKEIPDEGKLSTDPLEDAPGAPAAP